MSKITKPLGSIYTLKSIYTFIIISILIGIVLAIIQIFGLFNKIDLAIYGHEIFTKDNTAIAFDGILAIIIFSVVPGIAVYLWGNEKGLLSSFVLLVCYYFFSYIYYRCFGKFVPLVAPTIAVIVCIIRAFGYGLSFADKWWTLSDPTFKSNKSRIYQL